MDISHCNPWPGLVRERTSNPASLQPYPSDPWSGLAEEPGHTVGFLYESTLGESAAYGRNKAKTTGTLHLEGGWVGCLISNACLQNQEHGQPMKGSVCGVLVHFEPPRGSQTVLPIEWAQKAEGGYGGILRWEGQGVARSVMAGAPSTGLAWAMIPVIAIGISSQLQQFSVDEYKAIFQWILLLRHVKLKRMCSTQTLLLIRPVPPQDMHTVLDNFNPLALGNGFSHS